MSNTHSSTQLLTRIAAELERVTEMAQSLQGLMGRTMTPDYIHTNQDMQDLQSLDLLTQSTDGLAQFIHCLSDRTPNDWNYGTVCEIDNITLQDMANRLRGETPAKPENQITEKTALKVASSGEMDFF